MKEKSRIIIVTLGSTQIKLDLDKREDWNYVKGLVEKAIVADRRKT